MADLTKGEGTPYRRFKDMGDGTFAEVFVAQGMAADGAAASGSPVQMGGVDGAGNAQAMLTDTLGHQLLSVVPPGTPLNASSGNVAAAAAVATLAAVAGRTNYITGFVLTASGSTAALAVDVTVTGLIGGTATFTFTFPAGATVAATPLVVTFPTPVPASAANTAIVVTLPSGGAGNAHAAANAFGFLI